MAIDYTALLGLSAGIPVAKADFDVARDGGALYEKSVETGIVPSGSIILASLVLTKTAFTFVAGGYFAFRVNGLNVGLPSSTLGYQILWLPSAALALVTDKDTPVVGFVDTSACLTGVAQLWLFYLPT